jgi:hypothetical protein
MTIQDTLRDIGKHHGRRSTRHIVGDRVRVAVGVLAGLTGVVAKTFSSDRCALVIDGLEEGVYCVVRAGALEYAEPQDVI